MFKLYVGNLPPDITDGSLYSLFQDHGIDTSHVLLKTNYAFVDCPDQINVDKAIAKFNGYNLQGFVMQVEPSISRRSRRSNKIQIRNVPPHVSKEEIDHIVSTFGPINRCDHVSNEGVVYVTFDSQDLAQKAVAQLNGYDFQGSILKVDFAGNRSRTNRPNTNGNSGMMSGQDLPLRILVGREYVGAIIGKQGQTIKQITSQSNARIDVHRPPDNSAPETLVTIKGSSESCTTACKELMKVVQQEANSLNRTCSLRVLCPNSLCGRMIGKNGSVIKSIMQDSDSHIVVSSINDANVNNYFIDRVITISGTPEAMARAEKMISDRMKKCYAQDAQQMAIPPYMCDPHNMPLGMVNIGFSPTELDHLYQPMPLGLPAFTMMPGINNFAGLRPPYPPYMQGGNWYPGFCSLLPSPQLPPQPQQPEVTYLYIPERAVGSIIGSKGINIQNIKRESNARIKILPATKEGEDKKNPVIAMEERKVIIVGNSDAQWKAQFYLFEKIRDEGVFGKDDVKLRSEIMVPRSIIGRIIGRGGQNLREMRRVSRAVVKLPDDLSDEEVPVSIIGNFYSIQSAQRRIRDLMASAQHNPGPSQQQQGSPLSQVPPNANHQNRPAPRIVPRELDAK